MWIVKASLKNPYAIAVLVLIICFMGALALTAIPVDILPVFKAPAVQVMTYFQGMPTSSVEKTITNRIERWTNQATGCRLVESKSTQGVSIVRLYFRDDIDPNGALTQVNSLALGTLATLPPNTLPPVVLPFDPTGTLPLGVLSVRSPDLNETQLNDLARIEIRNMLGSVPGVVAPAVFGGKNRTILVYVDPVKLEARNLSPKDVVDALSRSNFMMTPGVAKFGNYEFQLDSNAMVESVADLNDIPLRIEPGNSIYLRDVGYAQDSNSIQTALVRINGHRQVYVPIYRQQGASSLTVVNGVKHELPAMEAKLPTGVKLDVVMDQSEYVREAIVALVHEGVIGAVLVAVMILIFLGNWRMTVIASVSIPLAILCAIIGLYATGNTINAMTLGGLALAIGPLVDNAIVVLENTHRHHALGKSRIKAAYWGAVEVSVPVLVATLTTMIVLCPIALMPGMGGFLFRPLTVALAMAMIASFLLSQSLVPVLCSRWLGGQHLEGEAHDSAGWGERLVGIIDRVLHFITRQYERLLDAALRRRRAVLIAVGFLFVASLGLVPFIGREFFPQVDAGQITLYFRSPSGTSLEENERRLALVEKFLEENIPAFERKMIISELGLVPDWSAAYTANSGSQDGIIKIQLTDERSLTAQEYAVKLRHLLQNDQRFADLHFSFNTGGMISAALNYGASSPIDIQIEGGSPTQAMELAQKIHERVRSIPGTADVRVLQRLDAPQRIIVVNRQKAADVGLSAYDVMTQVVTAMNSSVSVNRNFWIDTKSGNQYFVGVQYPENPDLKLQDVMNIVATGAKSSHPVKLGDLVRLEYGTAPVEANHVNLARVFNVLVNVEDRDLGGVAEEIKLRIPELADPPAGMRVALRGEYSRMQESFGSLGFGLAMAAVLVYLLLVSLFRSFVGPFIIMFAVPLGLIGVLAMLFLSHTTLNVQSSMGVIFMVGIVVANSVLLVDFANKQRKLGASVHEAITTAAAIRLRPILMTFFATFLDLLPMAIGLGRGSEANVPLARAVVGGLLTSTFLTLIVVPIMYTLLIKDSEEPEIDIDAELVGAETHDVGPDGVIGTS
ncbi:MAG: efflux RND transporter permease subunit [Planctomycetes bacterium]|nr:efflux RND transporter permease subunit [Planctomycetota bacterium]